MPIQAMYSYWPAHKTAERARKHEIPDADNWGRYKIRLLRETSDYEKAKIFARRAEDTSNVESDDEGPRRKRRPARLASSSSDVGADDSDLERQVVCRQVRKKKTDTGKNIPMPQAPRVVQSPLYGSKTSSNSSNHSPRASTTFGQSAVLTPRNHQASTTVTSHQESPSTSSGRRGATSESNLVIRKY
ncbi:uncharacterized protein LOC119738517 [Patiria miniata]|uniref:Uncharacterized protein n=1 Tax=Patiria miniata TaxID=46514 RepID=A0A914AYX2_PATMI|nr:uncharacterized protein LOC119738517 [Patiria miniata]